MNISVLVNEVGGGWSPADPFLRGSEEFVVECGREWGKVGHNVTVYHNGEHGTFDGVLYLPRELFRGGDDLVVVVKEREVLTKRLGKKVIYWTNELVDKDLLTPEKAAFCDAIVAISQYQKEHYLPQATHVIGHATSYGSHYDPNKKIPGLCLFASSPDRGLSELKRMWPLIKERVPQARLEVAYDGRSEREMEDLYDRADVWLYPCTGVELFCITARKCEAHGVIPVYYPHMALEETVRSGIATDAERFVDDAVRALTDEELRKDVRLEQLCLDYPTHADIAAALLATVE